MVLLAMVRERYKSVGLLLGIRRLPGVPCPLRVKAYIYSFRGTVPLINGEEIFYVVMMIIGVIVGASSPYEWLSESMVGHAAVRDRGKWSCRMIVGSDLLSLHLFFSLCR